MERIKKVGTTLRKKFFEILNFCLAEGNYFDFRSIVYQQTFSMPIGNPLSTVIADIVMQK